MSCKAHSDRGGAPEHQKALNAARDAWRASKGRGGDRTAKKTQGKALPSLATDSCGTTGFRIQGLGVLLTYQKFPDTGCWQAFLDHVKARLVLWKAKFWCATMDTNRDGTYHLHLMLQFYKAQDRQAQTFAFSGVRPNAQTNDLLGEGFCKKKLQQSLDRGFFTCGQTRWALCAEETESCW